MTATAVSNTLSLHNTIIGIKCKIYIIPPNCLLDQLNPAMTFNKIWPAIILANNRTDKDTIVIENPLISNGTIMKTIANGVPAGKNLPLLEKPCKRIPTNLLPNQTIPPLVNVITLCDVTVKL